MIYRFRIILDAHEDVFRDIEIEKSATLEDFHNVIIQTFGFRGQEMASFYISDEQWQQGEEIALFDMNEEPGGIRVMSETSLEQVIHRDQTRLIYVYDFLNLWTFLVELADIASQEASTTYPNLLFAHGVIPEEIPDKEFVSESSNDDELDDEFGLDPEGYNTLDFDENWN